MVFNLKQAFSPGANGGANASAWGRLAAPMDPYELGIALAGLALLLAYEIAQEKRDSELIRELNQRSSWIRWPVYYGLLFSVLLFGIFEHKEFVYFQF
jgi:hypothetical protein